MRALLMSLLLLLSCGPSTGGTVLTPVVLSDDLAPWTLTVDPPSRYDEVAAVVSRVVFAFHTDQQPVNVSVRFVATPGRRFCGEVYTVGCNPEPDLVEFDPDWAAYVVGHDLFHVFAEEFENPYPGRDPFHKDPRWTEWDQWRDGQL